MSDYLTSSEAGERLGVNASRVRQFYLAGRLPGKKLGRDLFFLRRDVEKFQQNPTGRPKKEPNSKRRKG